MVNDRCLILTVILTLLFALTGTCYASEKDLQDLLNLSIEDLLTVPLTSTSYIQEAYADAGSTAERFTQQDWQDRSARQLKDIFNYSPSVIAIPNFLGQYSVRIRGYAQSDARGVSTLWDGIPITNFNLGTSDIDTPDISLDTLKSIEIIRGPGSALYGSDAFHGVVSLTPFNSNHDTTMTNVRAGSNGFYSASLNNSYGLGNGWRLNSSFAYSGQGDQNRDYKVTVSGNEVTSERKYLFNNTTAVMKLQSDPARNLIYKFALYYNGNGRKDYHGEGGQGFTPTNDISSVDSNITIFRFGLDYKLSASRKLSLDTYTWQELRTYNRPVNATRNVTITGNEDRREAKLLYSDEHFTANTSITAALGVRHDVIDSQHRRIFNATTTFIDAPLPFSGVSRDIYSVLLDGHTGFANGKVQLKYGFRYDDYSDFGGHFTPRLGIIYHADKINTFKALYGNAFRAATAVEVGGSPFITGNPGISPEEINTYELTYLRQMKKSRLELVLFKSKFKNAITTIDTNNDGSDDAYANVGVSKSRGVELSYIRAINKWRISTSASYVKSENKTQNLDFSAFPQYIVNVGVGYQFPQNWNLFVNNRFHFDTNEGPPRSGNPNPDNLKTYWRADLNLNKKISSKMTAYANIRNLFDRKNYLPSLVEQQNGIPDEGISLDMGLRYQF